MGFFDEDRPDLRLSQAAPVMRRRIIAPAAPVPEEQIPGIINSGAVFSYPGREYRYRLYRSWAIGGKTVMFLMKNPSVGDENINDPTIKRCIGFAQRWGFGRLMICNTFAYVTSDSSRLARVVDPVGPENDRHLKYVASLSSLIICAYETAPTPDLCAQADATARRLQAWGNKLSILRLSPKGQRPEHPLYIPKDTIPQEWSL